MKKIYLIFSVLTLLSVTEANSQCKYGPRVSLGMSNLGGGGSGIGYQAGVFVNAELKDRIGIQGEVLFSVKNGNHFFQVQDLVNNTTLERTRKYSFTYIDIPIYGYVPLSKHITFLAGFQLGIVNGATERLAGSGVTAIEAQKRNIAGTDTKLGLAAGLDFNMASPLRFGFRFSTNGGETFLGRSSFIGATMAYYMDW